MSRTFWILALVGAFSACEAASSPEWGDPPPCVTDCAPAFDISGTYQYRYRCSQVALGGAQACVDPDGQGTITLTRDGSGNGRYTFGDPSGFHGKGKLVNRMFYWEAKDPAEGYEEGGKYQFTDANTFTADPGIASRYEYSDGTWGSCTAAGSRTGTPPQPAAIGACQ